MGLKEGELVHWKTVKLLPLIEILKNILGFQPARGGLDNPISLFYFIPDQAKGNGKRGEKDEW